MSQVDRDLAFSIEIAIFISMDVIEAIVLGERGIWDDRRSVVFPISEFFDNTVSIEVARCCMMAVTAAILGADHFGMVRTVAGMALLGIDGGKRGSDRDGIRASGRRLFSWKWGRWSGFGFAVAGPSINLSLAPGYMVILVGEVAVRAVSFLGFGSWCGDWEWFILDRVGRHSRGNDNLRGLTRKDLLKLILKPFLDKSWNPSTGIVDVSEVKTVGVRDHSVKRFLHFSEG